MPRPVTAIQRGFGSTAGARGNLASRRPTVDPVDRSRVSGSHLALYERHVAPLLSLGRLEEAEPILNLLSQSNTCLPDVYRDLATLSEARGDSQRALRHRDRWLDHPSNHLAQLEAQATLAEQLGRPEQSYRLWSVLLEREPGHILAVVASARYLLHLECFDEAYLVLQRASLNLASRAHSEAICLQAICALELSRPSEAVRLARSSLGQVESALAHACLAAALHQLADEQQALQHLQQALDFSAGTSDPPWPIPRLLASICLDQHRLPCAERLLQAACQHQPSSRSLEQKLGELLLMQGHLSRGFACLARSREPGLPGKTALPPFDVKAPSGPLALVADTTLGDTLMLSRYAPWIEERLQLQVNLYVQPPVLAVLRTSLPSSIGVYPLFQLQSQPYGSAIPILSVPGLFGACDRHPTLRQPCLKADVDRMGVWRERLALEPGERLIAINWHGSAMQALRERVASDIPLDTFAPLARLPQTRLVSLQKGFGAEQLKRCAFRDRFVTCQDALDREHRLEEMAALIALCDWVVCDDSGPAHLAGSLGRPTIVLLADRCDWRWGTNQERSPWYPSLHLIRHSGSSAEPWQGAMAEASALAETRLA